MVVAIVVGATLLACGALVVVVGGASVLYMRSSEEAGQASGGFDEAAGTWQEQAAAIDGIIDYWSLRPDLVEERRHSPGPVDYDVLPPVAGQHHPTWQNCQGDIYDAPIANEHAVHSLEHGAVWITYRPDLPADQVATLAGHVEGTEKLFMSPFPEQDAPISLQAWGYQLQVNDTDDSRIADFIRVLRVNASLEGPTATCGGGVTTTGTVPVG